MGIHYPTDPKVVNFSQAQELIARARRHGMATVLAHGVFDVLHIGHTTFLKDAKAAGDLLFVCLETDEGARMNKGSSRPLNPLEERLQLLADLQCVDYVFAFERAAPYGVSGTTFYNANLVRLHPDKLALSLGDPLQELRASNALALGIQPAIVRSVWREYSSTKLLANMHTTTR